MKLPLLNALCFQLGWFACVLGGSAVAVPVTAVLLLIHGKYFVSSQFEWLLIAGMATTGLLLDGLLGKLGIFTFEEQGWFLIPIWLLCLWSLFAATLCHSLAWLQHRLLLALILGAVAGPVSYLAGSKMSAVSLPQPLLVTIMVIGSVWAIVFPLSLYLARRCRR